MNWTKLILSLLICQGTGALAGFLTVRSLETWYDHLKKPSFNPPSWLFSPVWISLYFLMGLALYLIWQMPPETPGKNSALLFFLIQLVLNSAWSFVFFGLQKPWWAFFEILLMWVSIALTMAAFYPLSTLAFGLLIPYLAWVTFAVFLNFAIARLN